MEDNHRIQIPRLKLGSQGLEVNLLLLLSHTPSQEISRLGFGCAGLSGVYNDPLSHETGCSIIKEAFSKGVTFFDTSDHYGQNYDNEIMLGKALKQFPREKVHLATKLGIKSEGREYGVNGTPEYVRQSCEASLKRLDLDYIDLYYQHHVDVSMPIEDTVSVTTFHLKLKKLVEEGKIKYIGLSKASTETVRRAHVVHPITAVQVEYSLWTRDIEEDIIPLCRRKDMNMIFITGWHDHLHTGYFTGLILKPANVTHCEMLLPIPDIEV
ncbi:hypothetical protein CsSME_00033537 [Camellia sinensis var. sinensis]